MVRNTHTRFGRVYCLDLSDGDSLWARDLPDGVTGTPALADGYLYMLAQGDRSLYCLAAADGDSIWATELGSSWTYGSGHDEWMESSAAVVGDSVVYVGSRDGRMYCLYTDDGSVKWYSAVLGDYIASSPAYNNARVYVGVTGGGLSGEDSGVYALAAADGAVVWYYTYSPGNSGGTMSSPLVVDDHIYIGMNNAWDPENPNGGSITSFYEDREDEDVLPYAMDREWTYGIECDVRGTPVKVGDRIYVTSGRGLYAFKNGLLELGEGHNNGVPIGYTPETWSSITVSERFTVSEQETLLFVGDGGVAEDGYAGVYALDLDLNEVWSYDTECRVWASPAISGGKIVIGAGDGFVYCFVDDQQGNRILAPGGSVTYLEGDGARASVDAMGPVGKNTNEWLVSVEPNPSAGHVTLQLDLPGERDTRADVAVFDVSGRLIARLGGSISESGKGSVEWDGRTMAGKKADAGVYLYRLNLGRGSHTGSFVLRR